MEIHKAGCPLSTLFELFSMTLRRTHACYSSRFMHLRPIIVFLNWTHLEQSPHAGKRRRGSAANKRAAISLRPGTNRLAKHFSELQASTRDPLAPTHLNSRDDRSSRV